MKPRTSTTMSASPEIHYPAGAGCRPAAAGARRRVCAVRFRAPRAAGQRGMALVITLSIVVLMTFVVVAFFSAATANRAIENTSAGGVSAQLLAEGAIGAIEGEFVNEIIAGSNSTVSGNATVYSPKAPSGMVPYRAVPASISGNDTLNLVKQSGQPFFTAGSPSIFSFSASGSTSDASANKRTIAPARWAAPMLAGGNFTAPNWIYVNPDGYRATPDGNTIGRVAFNVYDVGGLLDINAAGFAPTSAGADPEEMPGKGSSVWADLRALPGINPSAYAANVDWPPKWRITGPWESFTSNATVSSLPYYQRTGWLQPYSMANGQRADRMFTTRQDLIRYAKANPATFTANPDGSIPALQYLTTFSRDLNQPSFAPEAVRPKVLRETAADFTNNVMKSGNAFAYGADDKVNLPFLQQRVSAAFPRYSLSSTGFLQTTQAKEGEPLVLKRFPLSRLKLFEDRNVVALPNSPIHRFFGLYRSSANDPWRYNPDASSAGDPSTSAVLNLDEIKGREPNLFELLRAAIHWGSLGKSIGDTAAIVDAVDSVPNYQIAQIVAAMIDQTDPDSFPTAIGMDGREFYGAESVPYLSRVCLLPKRAPFAGTQATTAGVWIVPELWNPYNPTSPTPGAVPTKFRFTADGVVAAFFKQSTGGAPNWSSPLVALTTGDRGLQFTDRDPDRGQSLFAPTLIWKQGITGATPISPSSGDDSTATTLVTGAAQEPILGIFTGGIGKSGSDTSAFTAKTTNGIPTTPTTWVARMAWGTGVEIITNLHLQYQDGSQWRTYASWKGWNWSVGETGHGSSFNLRHLANFLAANFQVGVVSDPRTFRFGLLGNPNGQFQGPGPLYSASPPINGTTRPDASDGARCGVTGSGGSRPFFPGLWTQNSEPNNTSTRFANWLDPDGVQRKAMGAYVPNPITSTTGLPMADAASRPLMLNRPFRSVAELGYVFRGAPWKNLDFFTKESGDSALLDVFCMEEDDTPDALVAGRVNLNTRQPKVIEALITGAAKTAQGTEPITAIEVTRAAAELTKWTATKPFKNPAELIGRPVSTTQYEGFSDVLGNILSGNDLIHHHRRETVLRALSGSGTTRTWNVMVDVIAQSGKQAASGFMVEGEHRAWIHLAIDRFTGKILDRTVESVIE